MVDRGRFAWLPTAAYLYVLHLDGLGLAWEYLRRHPDYRRDWRLRRRRPAAACRWGLRLFEDPLLDARDALPAWFPDHDRVVRLVPDVDPPPAADPFALWRIPGRRRMIHDGHRLLLATRWPGCDLRLSVALGLGEGMAYAYAMRPIGSARRRMRAFAGALDQMAVGSDEVPSALTRPRPSREALLEMRTLQTLDATLAGASVREIADGLFGAEAMRLWHADSGLRSRVRRLVQRGLALMRSGYRRLAQLDQ